MKLITLISALCLLASVSALGDLGPIHPVPVPGPTFQPHPIPFPVANQTQLICRGGGYIGVWNGQDGKIYGNYSFTAARNVAGTDGAALGRGECAWDQGTLGATDPLVVEFDFSQLMGSEMSQLRVSSAGSTLNAINITDRSFSQSCDYLTKLSNQANVVKIQITLDSARHVFEATQVTE